MMRKVLKRFQDLSVNRKLNLMLVMTSSVALLLACSAFIITEIVTFRTAIVRNLTVQAKIIGNNSTAALTFGDKSAAREVLQALEADIHIKASCIYDKDGKPFAVYQRGGGKGDFKPPEPGIPGHVFYSGDLELFHPITLDGENIGLLYLNQDLEEMNSRIKWFSAIVLAVLLVSMLAALGVSARMRKLLSEPILRLAVLARAISLGKDYSARAVKEGDDEIGRLTEAFNDMLEQIQKRDLELQSAHDELEKRVQDRTKELIQEISTREKAEKELRRRTNQVIHHQAVLLELAKTDHSNLDSAIRRITETVSAALGVERVSVWIFNEDHDAITCQDLHKNTPQSHEKGTILRTKDYPSYFQAVEASRTIAAHNALTDPRTREFSEGYLKVLGITSMLDVSIRLHGKVVGVFCSEHTGPARDWTLEEQDFAASVADLLSLVMEASERKNAEEDRRKLQNQLAQSEKLAAVGQLAGGVAHEINNPLGVILGFAQSILNKVDPGHSFVMPLKSIEREAVRCKNLVQDLLTFSRVGKAEKEECDLNSVISAALTLVEGQAKIKEIEMVRDMDPYLPKVFVNQSQVQQIIINLSNNAIDAMTSAGTLTIRTRSAEQDGRPGAIIEVQDTGLGIPAELQSKIFEPFFTTKEVGKGTGLGLSLVYEIIQKHQGSAELFSEEGKGTLFRIFLPCFPGEDKLA